MNYKQFLEEILRGVKEKMQMVTEVRLEPILKNNGIELDSLIILQEKEVSAPNIYLNSYYACFQAGMSLEAIVERIIAIYEKSIAEKSHYPLENGISIDCFRNKIFYRLVNFNYNKKLLLEIPYVRFMDLAVTFHCLVQQKEEGVGTLRITKKLQKEWGISKNELWSLAQENTPKLFPARLQTMQEVMGNILREDLSQILQKYDRKNITEESLEEWEHITKRIVLEMEKEAEYELFILTNEVGVFGASVFLYKNLIRNFAKNCEADIFILPSSVHETLLIPKRGILKKSDLEQMVCDINRTQVALEDLLSNNVYIYQRKTNMFH